MTALGAQLILLLLDTACYLEIGHQRLMAH